MRFNLDLLWIQCLMTTAFAPHDCNFYAQTTMSQHLDIYGSMLAEPPSAIVWVLFDPPRSRARFLAVFEKWGEGPPIEAGGGAQGGNHPQPIGLRNT